MAMPGRGTAAPGRGMPVRASGASLASSPLSSPMQASASTPITGASTPKIEAITGTLISDDTQKTLMAKMKDFGDNEERLKHLEEEKGSYLFSSNHLLELCTITNSKKTRLAMIEMIAPRLTDPKAKMTNLTDLFPYNEDKEKVTEWLKNRMTKVASRRFTNTSDVGSLLKGISPQPGGIGQGGAGARSRRLTISPGMAGGVGM